MCDVGCAHESQVLLTSLLVQLFSASWLSTRQRTPAANGCLVPCIAAMIATVQQQLASEEVASEKLCEILFAYSFAEASCL